jgi:acetyl-CoA acetyltransferase family protein
VALTDSYTGAAMAITAENLAAQYGISRQACDEYSVRTQQAYKKAFDAGFFKEEIAPIELQSRKGPVVFDTDEHPRPATTLEALSRLKPVFKKDGVVTAGNASGICDGGAAVIVTTMDYAKAHGLKPLGRLVGWGISGCDPTIMGIGPVPAARQAFARTGLGLQEMSLIEVNEAFAPQYLAVEKALELDRERTNVHGGAIAIGHPLATSGTRITLTLLCALRKTGGRFGLGSACIGGGQGIAVIVEAL